MRTSGVSIVAPLMGGELLTHKFLLVEGSLLSKLLSLRDRRPIGLSTEDDLKTSSRAKQVCLWLLCK